MNPFRAKRIADRFSVIGMYKVKNKLSQLQVSFNGSKIYFEREEEFWAFMIYLAASSHHEEIIDEIQHECSASLLAQKC